MKGLKGVIGRVRSWRRGWHERSKLQRIDLYTRITLCSITWFFAVSWGLLPLGTALGEGPVAISLAGAFLVANVAQSVLSNRDLTAAFAHYRGGEPFPRGRLRLPAAIQVVMTGLLVGLAAVGGVKEQGLALLVLDLPVAFAIPYVLLIPVRRFLLHCAAYAAVVVALLAAVGVPGRLLFAAAVSLLVVSLLVLVSARPSVWSLTAMWQAEEARDMQARLAVAEERLRFGRDMHDVLGRNLSVIALKSELAVELAQRGNPAAVDQMVEVQRIARASQQEVRDVVRGYREADLPTELMGARGVLEAAGISVSVEGADGPAGIGAPAAVQAALGWVVRETATNVPAPLPDPARAHPGRGGPGGRERRGRPHGFARRRRLGDRRRFGPGRAARAARGARRHARRRRSRGRPVPGDGDGAARARPRGAGRTPLPLPLFRCPFRPPGGTMTTDRPLRVLLADDEHLIRGALAALLALEEDLVVVAEAASGPEALAMARAHRPDVAVLDLQMPGADGVKVATALRAELPDCRTMIVTSHGRPGHLKRALAAGVRGFVPKTVSARRLAEIIRTVHAGNRYVDPELAADAISAGDSPLTAREAEVLELAADGAPVAEIAERASLSQGTVRNYLSSAASKIGAENRHTAVRLARERGWV